MNYSKPKPYLIRAFYEWITDNGLTPYILINTLFPGCMVPVEHIKDNKIVLNIAHQVVNNLLLGNEAIEFKAKFSGVPRQIYIPIEAITAIYAKENGEGMSFPEEFPTDDDTSGTSSDSSSKGSSSKAASGKPNLKIVK